MDEAKAPPLGRPGEAATGLMLAAGSKSSMAALRVGINEIGKRSTETAAVLAAFVERHPEIAQGFMERAAIDPARLASALERERDPEPPPAARTLPENPTEDQRKFYEIVRRMDDERRAEGRAEPFSGPVKAAMLAARDAARTEKAKNHTVCALAAALIETEGHARDAVREVAAPARLPDALVWLRAQPDPPERGRIVTPEEIAEQGRRTMDAVWPQIQAKMRAAGDDKLRDELYERDPARYETPLDVAADLAKEPPLPEHAYAWRAGVCRRAAENEARIRKASEATLDHLLLTLLRDGADTARFLDRRGVDRADWSRRLDAALPRFAEGPRWPPADRALGMAQPDNMVLKVKPIPKGVDFDALPKEEARKYIERTFDPDVRFTDLKMAAKLADEPDTLGFALLQKAGITKDDLKAETIARERGDDEWWRKPPDLVRELREAKERRFLSGMEASMVCGSAAQFEARMRGAETAAFDDLLVALLVPGTDLWTLLDDLGTDPIGLRERVAALRPRFVEGPLFPSTDDLHLGIMGLTKKGFSDLLYVRKSRLRSAEPSPGLRLLREAGLTPEAVEERLRELGVEPF